MNLKTSPIPPNMLQQRSQQTAISCYKWGTPKMLQRLSHWKAPVSLFFGYPSLAWKASLTRNLGCSFKHYICIDEYIYMDKKINKLSNQRSTLESTYIYTALLWRLFNFSQQPLLSVHWQASPSRIFGSPFFKFHRKRLHMYRWI